MAAGMQGMDTDEARQYASGMDKHAQGVGSAFGSFLSNMHARNWTGSDHEKAMEALQEFSGELKAGMSTVHENAAVMRRQADLQDQVSGG